MQKLVNFDLIRTWVECHTTTVNFLYCRIVKIVKVPLYITFQMLWIQIWICVVYFEENGLRLNQILQVIAVISSDTRRILRPYQNKVNARIFTIWKINAFRVKSFNGIIFLCNKSQWVKHIASQILSLIA